MSVSPYVRHIWTNKSRTKGRKNFKFGGNIPRITWNRQDKDQRSESYRYTKI